MMVIEHFGRVHYTSQHRWLAAPAAALPTVADRLLYFGYSSAGEARIEPEYLENRGIRVLIPALQPDERCQIRFVVAWARRKPEDAWTWYGVDRAPDEILVG